MDSFWNKTADAIAKRLPRRVVYFALIRAWAFATTGRYGTTIATHITADEVVRRWASTPPATGDTGGDDE